MSSDAGSALHVSSCVPSSCRAGGHTLAEVPALQVIPGWTDFSCCINFFRRKCRRGVSTQ